MLVYFTISTILSGLISLHMIAICMPAVSCTHIGVHVPHIANGDDIDGGDNGIPETERWLYDILADHHATVKDLMVSEVLAQEQVNHVNGLLAGLRSEEREVPVGGRLFILVDGSALIGRWLKYRQRQVLKSHAPNNNDKQDAWAFFSDYLGKVFHIHDVPHDDNAKKKKGEEEFFIDTSGYSDDWISVLAFLVRDWLGGAGGVQDYQAGKSRFGFVLSVEGKGANNLLEWFAEYVAVHRHFLYATKVVGSPTALLVPHLLVQHSHFIMMEGRWEREWSSLLGGKSKIYLLLVLTGTYTWEDNTKDALELVDGISGPIDAYYSVMLAGPFYEGRLGPVIKALRKRLAMRKSGV